MYFQLNHKNFTKTPTSQQFGNDSEQNPKKSLSTKYYWKLTQFECVSEEFYMFEFSGVKHKFLVDKHCSNGSKKHISCTLNKTHLLRAPTGSGICQRIFFGQEKSGDNFHLLQKHFKPYISENFCETGHPTPCPILLLTLKTITSEKKNFLLQIATQLSFEWQWFKINLASKKLTKWVYRLNYINMEFQKIIINSYF